jgi:hypothetical protein
MKLAIAAALAVLAVPLSAGAQGSAAPQTDVWGTQWTTTQTVGAWSFVGPMSDGGDGYRECSTPTGGCRAAVDLPTGLSIHNLELDGCDTSPVTETVVQLWACGPAPGPGTCAVVAEGRSGLADIPGCSRFRSSVLPQLMVNNYNFTYFIDVFGSTGAGNAPVRFRGVRLAMLRNVSDPPATPTFTDVPPSHPYYRHIEALADALISAGCGNGQYCPERPMTRGELAVLLAEALGLNFPD